ncbi:hypothetical protein GUITHDRAFT_99542 [Guillardia theta CCMP2712]|uniref:Uncharacterized protein n=1 Tax=Guillardia theta (strain CCMP2712) TaxID=905079 RepID=L1K239_GUITC|nr:hypothetical protein GUITHDRAFT_99542 [Guillardia theta CCMP2712]EKX54891.1 hypothetical protein GUITHDRAFT_99542 [Guillardia theta CCMP2712]|eukprot:XP_005841871.1 hypothetical protein GUITHDRAFT_99542 [Guillardia theta CCMP2712]
MGGNNIFVVDPWELKFVECFMDQKVNRQGNKYYLCYPCDTPVAICKWSEKLGICEIHDRDLNGQLDAAREVLATKNLKLVRSAVALTVQGELVEQVELTPPPHEVLEDREEFVRIIAKFLYRNEIHLVTELLDPVLIVCKEGVLSTNLQRDLKEKFQNEQIQVLELMSELDLITVFPKIEDSIAKRFVKFLPHQ